MLFSGLCIYKLVGDWQELCPHLRSHGTRGTNASLRKTLVYLSMTSTLNDQEFLKAATKSKSIIARKHLCRCDRLLRYVSCFMAFLPKLPSNYLANISSRTNYLEHDLRPSNDVDSPRIFSECAEVLGLRTRSPCVVAVGSEG
jgi:hypothetical protein